MAGALVDDAAFPDCGWADESDRGRGDDVEPVVVVAAEVVAANSGGGF